MMTALTVFCATMAAALVPAPRTFVELPGECRLTGDGLGFASIRDVTAAKRIQGDIDGERWPEKRIFSESMEIDRRSRERIASVAALALKESGQVDVNALKIPKGTLQQAQ